MPILILNIGSSSIKFQLLKKSRSNFHSMIKGKIDHLAKTFEVFIKNKKSLLSYSGVDIEKNIKKIAELIKKIPGKINLRAVAHRVVHGGEKYTDPVIITKKILKNLEKLNTLAPLHNPYNLTGIRAAQKIFPHIPNIAVFDTGFYKTLPQKAFLYAVPLQWYKKFAVRRYGFHGINHEYVTQETLKKLKKKNAKIISCHLGAGCSITASINGKAIETSMGFTPLEGIPMATRSGDIDPALVPYLMKKLKCSAEEIIKKLNKKSGLKGLSGISDDMRVLLKKAKKGHTKSAFAIEIFCYRIAKYIGSYTTAMNGLDAITFTGGIGENAESIRKKNLAYLKFLKPQPKIFIIPANEEIAIAKKIYKLTS